uniref:Zinc finger CCCH domain-containing protein 32-like isoform X1 n=1 Tax=Cymbidium ensifolium TaxID=78740 RepID=A0A5J6NDP3_CYMEN|nr:zinc finger CCCH domain-containing protein 32-like isoform X1 [Cymbidium ensifolium]
MDSSSGRSDPRTLTAEEEAIKLNTDCVYFLASPLTCKKGSECEYRHSEGARLNPRDCRFWLSGNCLNPKCLFRHPPLDGMVVSPRTTSGKIITSHVSPSVQLPMANSFTYNFGRNSVPCYYYLKGACLKGDKCPFMHGPLPVGNPIAKQNANVSAQITTQLETPEEDAGKIKERNNQQNLPTALNIGNVSADKLVNGLPSLGKGSRTLENAPGSWNGLARSQTTYDPPVRSNSSYSSSQNLHVQPERHLLRGRETGEIFEESSGVGYIEPERPLNQLQSPSDHYQNPQAAEEVFRDSSPGFDVLVDHVVTDTDYFHGKDGFRSGISQGRRNVNLADDYGHYHSDYESSTRLDMFRHDGTGEFHYGNEYNGDDWDQHMTSSTLERMMDGPLLTERSLARRRRSPDEMEASDLRHRLRKQRRQDGYFSATSSVRHHDPYSKHDKNMKDRYRTRNSYKDQQLHGSATSSRLRGRITLPKPSSPEILSDLQDVRDKGRQRVRLSPLRPSGNPKSLGQRLGWRPLEESFFGPRYFGRQQKTRDALDLLDFAGPKSLEELKGAKADRNAQGQSIKHNPSTSSLEHNRSGSGKASRPRDSATSVDFEGPKPLSVLLKRKRESGSENDAISTVSNLEVTEAVSNVEEPRVGTVEESLIPTEDEQINYGQQAAGDETEAKDAIEDEEDPDYTDQKDGEYYYNTVEGGDYKEEDDDMDHIDEDLDAEEDEDDFAKKIGLIFS